jgi:hypothetical protein
MYTILSLLEMYLSDKAHSLGLSLSEHDPRAQPHHLWLVHELELDESLLASSEECSALVLDLISILASLRNRLSGHRELVLVDVSNRYDILSLSRLTNASAVDHSLVLLLDGGCVMQYLDLCLELPHTHGLKHLWDPSSLLSLLALSVLGIHSDQEESLSLVAGLQETLQVH